MGAGNILLNFFFPPRCPFCGELGEDDGLCPICQRELPWIGDSQRPAKGEWMSGCYAPLWYEKKVVSSFHRYKFGGLRRYYKMYGLLMAQSIEDRLECQPDLITWAPVSRRRRMRRGYDQSQLLAVALSRQLGIPLVSTLKKWRHTAPQSSLESVEEKRVNALGAYCMAKHGLVRDKCVLLVDDIITTGSTLSECARILRTAGAREVVCVTLARADKTT